MDVKEIVIRNLIFDPNLQFGYQQRFELEPELLIDQEKLKWTDHLVWIHPIWRGGLPGITKGFNGRVFLPGFAFR